MTSREWAADTDAGIWTIAGPIFPARPKTIGRTRVAVPAANWKIVLRGDRAVAVIIPNLASYVAPHRWDDFIVPIAEVERQAGIRISLPAGISRVTREPAWPVDRAVDEICQQAGEHFDPRVVEAFCTLPHAALVDQPRTEVAA